ncbi:LPS export ABC transporter periplasmic protein LptC [Candidatus Omnitrophota bacterium]
MRPIFLFLCLISIVALGCAGTDQADQAEPVDQTDQEDLAEAPDEMLSSFSVSGYGENGMRQWDLEGTSADIMTQEIKLENVKAKVYGQDTNMNIVAETGSLNRADNNVHLEKNVVVTSDDGARLTADYLDWNAQNQTMATDSPVWIQRGVMQAKGVGLMAQPELQKVALKKDVTVEVSFAKESAGLEASQPSSTVITCDGPLDVDYQNNLAIFHDNVNVQDARGEIFSNKMDVYFGAGDSAADAAKQVAGMEGVGIDKVVAWGDVQIHHGENTTYSQKAVYDTRTGKLTLTGQPQLVIYSADDLAQMSGAKEGQ